MFMDLQIYKIEHEFGIYEKYINITILTRSSDRMLEKIK